METVFEHQITQSEIAQLEVIDTLMGETKDNYKEWVSKDTALADIVRLYQLRGNEKIAADYLIKITDKSIQEALNEIKM